MDSTIFTASNIAFSLTQCVAFATVVGAGPANSGTLSASNSSIAETAGQREVLVVGGTGERIGIRTLETVGTDQRVARVAVCAIRLIFFFAGQTLRLTLLEGSPHNRVPHFCLYTVERTVAFVLRSHFARLAARKALENVAIFGYCETFSIAVGNTVSIFTS